MKVGDLVTPLYGGAENQVGVVLSEPELVTTPNGVDIRVVDVEWIGWNLREKYSYPHLKVISKGNKTWK
tara:strand:+ start:1261 stop:1467 length:207 start_codon:yes stop_codon:yes gene_type:complete